MTTAPGQIISTILKHDAKVTSYKIALLRAINDVVLSFPDLRTFHQDVAIPLRTMARFWLAYYWPFVAPDAPIRQGPRAVRGGQLTHDMAFREALTAFRAAWERTWGELSRPADGFLAIHEFCVPRRRESYPPELLQAYEQAIRAISETIKMPIRHAGPGEWTVFEQPVPYRQLRSRAVSIPGTDDRDVCLVVPADLWQSFQQLSLYIEALCIHEWCLFTERVTQDPGAAIDRGQVYRLLTDRPGNRRPLTWERNQVDLLLMEGQEFTCPWTARRIRHHVAYDLDHLLPVSVYPINELWNLVPADPEFNTRTKRDRLPTPERLVQATPHLQLAYANYNTAPSLAQALREDVGVRFATVQPNGPDFPLAVAEAVVYFIDQVGAARNLARF